jgi:crotonobetainyl-CoA:carnitine CoA-transferase CaiB-like acyl-CoA transferase
MTGLMPLDDTRVIDLTQYTAGPFCTRILADYGADVIKIERPGGDPARALPPFPKDEPHPERSGTFLFLNTSKRSVVLDLKAEAGRDRLLDLVAGADALVESFRPGTLDRLGLGYEALREVNPRLVLTSITNFGQDGPYRDYLGTDLTLYGMGGAMFAQGDVDHEPVKTAGRVTTYHAGYVGALATAVALRAAEARGAGEHVDVSVFETATHSIDLRLARLMGFQHSGHVATRPARISGVGTGAFPCADGFYLLTGGPAYLPAMLRMIGRDDLLDDLDWATPAARAEPDRIEEFVPILLPWMIEHTRAEVRDACQEFGVLGGPINSIADLFVDPNFEHREFFQTIDHPETGPLRYPGFHARLHREGEPMPERRRAPLLGEHTAEVLAELEASPAPQPAPAARATTSAARLPLEGMRILDFTVVWAGPYSTMQLADWGAEVIRVESLQHIAPATRGQLAHPPRELVLAQGASGMGYPDDDAGERPWNRAAPFNCHARNKLSMTVDLTRPEGQEVFERLVAMSDGLIENNLPPNIEKQGITWERLSKINPNLVLLRIPGFGIDGPYRGYRTMGHHMEALAGHPAIRSYPNLSLEYIPLGVPSDAASGIGSALAFLMGMRYRERTGQGLMVELATAENFMPMLGEFILDYSMNGRLWEQMGNDHWWIAPHNVYPSYGDDCWVTIAARDEREWRALCEVMRREDLAGDARFADMASRHANRRELDAEIAAWTSGVDAYWVMHRLQQAGVPAGVVMNEADAFEDRQHDARGFFQEIAHPEAGTHQHVGRVWRAGGTPPTAARHAPLLGQDNDYVYRELLGFSDAEYARFEQLGHIGTEYEPSIP